MQEPGQDGSGVRGALPILLRGDPTRSTENSQPMALNGRLAFKSCAMTVEPAPDARQSLLDARGCVADDPEQKGGRRRRLERILR